MSRRSRKHKKQFSCGHRGYGRYCHRCHPYHGGDRCEEAQNLKAARRLEKQRVRQQWQQTFLSDRIDLTHLPKKIVLKARQIMTALNQGVSLHTLRGKHLSFNRQLIRIPVTYRYRLLCQQDALGIEPLKVITHETYNPIAKNTFR